MLGLTVSSKEEDYDCWKDTKTWSLPIKSRLKLSVRQEFPLRLSLLSHFLHIWSLWNLFKEELRKTSGRRGAENKKKWAKMVCQAADRRETVLQFSHDPPVSPSDGSESINKTWGDGGKMGKGEREKQEERWRSGRLLLQNKLAYSSTENI